MNKKEERRLAFKEKIQLKLHLRICDFCTRFQKQVHFFTSNAPHTHNHIHQSMRDELKKAIREQLKN